MITTKEQALAYFKEVFPNLKVELIKYVLVNGIATSAIYPLDPPPPLSQDNTIFIGTLTTDAGANGIVSIDDTNINISNIQNNTFFVFKTLTLWASYQFVGFKIQYL